MLDKNINLKINVVSHTDNIGNINYNMKLSQSKAKAIENELITRYKIPVQRLKIYGVASLAFTAQMLQQYLNNTSKEEIT
jgi:outer membrane protein OmpA-like peptidoglycan-associated protein